MQGAGWLLAEAAAGVAHGLHSRAPLLLSTLLAEGVLPLSALCEASGRVRSGWWPRAHRAVITVTCVMCWSADVRVGK